jgi:hypothetical protein
MISETQIQELAYELYVRYGYKDGHDLEDWFEAEKILNPSEKEEE